MSFSESSEDPRLVQGRFLAAICDADIGFKKWSQLDLAMYIGNVDGELQWADKGCFANDAENIELVGEEKKRHILKANLPDGKGSTKSSTLDLDEKISVFDGNLVCDLA